MLIVMKFGGTSVGSAERITQAAQLATSGMTQGHRVVVVTSAMSGVTNTLIDAATAASKGQWDPQVRQALFARHAAVAEALIQDADRRAKTLTEIDRRLDRFEKLCYGLSMVHELTPRLLDAISGTGEMLAAPLVASAIAVRGVPSSAVDATELIVTTDQFGGAEPLMDETRAKTKARLEPLLAGGEIPVVTGFIGATADGVLTTLGRGGSDYSASIVGAALDADEVWIWTDVDGVMTANPADVPEARTLSEISYSEASELAYYGAKVLHYKTIIPAFRQRIPVRILNSFNPSHPGTRVSVEGDASALGVKAVTSIRGVSLIAISGTGMQGIPGIVARAFDVVADQQSNVLMISQASSENNICFVISTAEAPRVVKALRAALDVDLTRGHIEEISRPAGGRRGRGRRPHARNARHCRDGLRRARRRRHQRDRDLARVVRAEHLDGRGRGRRVKGGPRIAPGVPARGRVAEEVPLTRVTISRLRAHIAKVRQSAPEAVAADLRLAIRSLRATPVVTFIAVLSLALGIGANTAIFSLVDHLVLRSLPVREPARLALVATTAQLSYKRTTATRCSMRWPLIQSCSTACSPSADCCGQSTLAVGDLHEFVDRLFVSGSYFATLGVNVLLGRVLTPADDELVGGPDGTAVVLSYTAWKRHFNGDAKAVGMHVLLDRVPVTIVGVLPPFFLGTEVGRTLDVFLPVRGASAVLATTPFDRYSTWLNVIVRLKPGQTVASSSASLRGLQPDLRSTTRPP